MRNLEKYTEDYLEKGFEDWQVRYRRRKILETIMNYSHENIMEIGCGMEPLFCHLDCNSYKQYIVYEPSVKFYKNAVSLAKTYNNIQCINEEFVAPHNLVNRGFDFIICSGLLHEVEKPLDLLKDIKKICHHYTTVHINVPNANSFHRLLGKNMGIIQDVKELTRRNHKYQQHRVFTMDSLMQLVQLAGFSVKEYGSYFIKPFTHDQMYEMVKNKIIDESTLDGLYKMNDYSWANDIGSEIFVNLGIE